MLSERQYKTAFKRWGLQKNVTGANMKHLIRIRKKRFEREGKSTEFTINKRRVSDAKIERWKQRTGFDVQMTMSGPPLNPKTPSSIEYKTPQTQIHLPETPRSPTRKAVANRTSPGAGEFVLEDTSDFMAPSLMTPRTFYLSPGYDVGQWFALHDVHISPCVVAELHRKAQSKPAARNQSPWRCLATRSSRSGKTAESPLASKRATATTLSPRTNARVRGSSSQKLSDLPTITAKSIPITDVMDHFEIKACLGTVARSIR